MIDDAMLSRRRRIGTVLTRVTCDDTMWPTKETTIAFGRDGRVELMIRMMNDDKVEGPKMNRGGDTADAHKYRRQHVRKDRNNFAAKSWRALCSSHLIPKDKTKFRQSKSKNSCLWKMKKEI